MDTTESEKQISGKHKGFLEKHLWAQILAILLTVFIFLYLFYQITYALGFYGLQAVLFLVIFGYFGSKSKNRVILLASRFLVYIVFVGCVIVFFLDWVRVLF